MFEKWLIEECDCCKEAHLGLKPHNEECSIHRIKKYLSHAFEVGFWIGWLVAVLMCLVATGCSAKKVFPLIPEDCTRPCADEYSDYVWQHDTGMRPHQARPERRKR